MTQQTRARNPRGEGTRLRDEIVDAAISLIEEPGGGASALTLRAVARRAGISAPSIYAHFDDLAAIADAVLAQSFDELHTAVAKADTGADDPVDRVIAMALAYVEFAWERRARYAFMFTAEGYSPTAVRSYELLRQAIADCVAAGRSRSDDPHLDTWMVWAALHGAATLEKPARSALLRLGPLDRRRLVAEMVSRLARITEAGA